MGSFRMFSFLMCLDSYRCRLNIIPRQDNHSYLSVGLTYMRECQVAIVGGFWLILCDPM